MLSNRPDWSALLCALSLCSQAFAGEAARTLDIYWIDSEGGGSTLIVTPAGQSVLIDTGNPAASGTNAPIGRDAARILHVATSVVGLKRLDHLITTHFHRDHYGGAPEVAGVLPIEVVHDNGIPNRDPDGANNARFAASIEPYRSMKVGRRVVIQPGDRIALEQGRGAAPLSLRCLGTRKEFVAPPAGAETNPLCAEATSHAADTSDNCNSTVWLLQFGDFDFFDGGDLTWNTEGEFVCPVSRVGPVDVYQVNHHGLDLSNNPLLVRALAPTVSVMNNGPTKGCQPMTFTTLKDSPTIQAMYQLHRNLRPDGATHNTAAEFIANLTPTASCEGNYIKCSVAPDGKSYTISIPANGHQRTYQSK